MNTKPVTRIEKSEGDVNLSPRRREWQEAHLDAATRALLEEDARLFLHQSLSTPCLNVLTGCSGARITDAQGRSYLDFHGNNVHQVGFGNAEVIEAVVRQLQTLPFCTRRYTNVPAIELARKLVELAPGDLSRVLFAPGGAEAIGMAMKLARIHTGRHKVVSLWDSFHGASLDAISVGGEALFRRGIGPLLPGVEHAPPPDPANCPFRCGSTCNLGCADYIDYILEKEGDVGAVLAETVRSTPYIPEKGYWKRIREACDRHGALLILDEIPHCLGRTGKFFTFEHYGIVPDMVVIGKGLGGGILPIAALIAREFLNTAGQGALGHYTHEKSPVCCAAALATIRHIEQHDLAGNAARMGERLLAGLRRLQEKHPMVMGVRGIGLLCGVEIGRVAGAVREPLPDQADAIMYEALSRGLSFKVTMGNILTLTPALTISPAEVDEAIAILDQSLAAAALSRGG